jgi:hypothetical protein
MRRRNKNIRKRCGRGEDLHYSSRKAGNGVQNTTKPKKKKKETRKKHKKPRNYCFNGVCVLII